jgi:hypothetical protein
MTLIVYYITVNENPTDEFYKQIQKILKELNKMLDKNNKKRNLQIKPNASALNARIKIYKENPIRPTVNGIHAPS